MILKLHPARQKLIVSGPISTNAEWRLPYKQRRR
jgi:hypothetical protein